MLFFRVLKKNCVSISDIGVDGAPLFSDCISRVGQELSAVWPEAVMGRNVSGDERKARRAMSSACPSTMIVGPLTPPP
jgi:hypothetical protein